MATWIFPLTILPGIGLLIMSTTNWAVALTNEINHLLDQEYCNQALLTKKIKQLSLINQALVALYLCTAMCAAGGFVGGILQSEMETTSNLPIILLCIGMFFLMLATSLLIIYAYRATNIKRNQYLDQLKK